MKKLITNILGMSFALTAVFSTAALAQAQTVHPTPVFYNQSGVALNPGNTALASGWYYNQAGQSVYYYGDGTYYDPETGTYYGLNGSTMAVANPSAGIAAEEAGASTVPAAPDTGAGGEAGGNIVALLLSGLVAAAGVTYLVKKVADRKQSVAA